MKKFSKKKVLRTKLKKDEGTLHVIMDKEGSVVDNKFYTMFICNFRESLTLMRLTESKGK